MKQTYKCILIVLIQENTFIEDPDKTHTRLEMHKY